MSSKSIFWFRRDLRLTDNHGLFQALTQNKAVFPIFIFDSNITETLEKNDHRLLFISKQLDLINLELKKHNSSLTIFKYTSKSFNTPCCCNNIIQLDVLTSNEVQKGNNTQINNKLEYLKGIVDNKCAIG